MTTTGKMESDGFEYEIIVTPPTENHFKKALLEAKRTKEKREQERYLRERYGYGRKYIPESRKRSLSSIIAKSYTPRCDR